MNQTRLARYDSSYIPTHLHLHTNRALRFNTFFTSLDLTHVHLEKYSSNQRFAWAMYLAEALLYNTTIQAVGR